MRPTHVLEGNLLYLKSIDLIILHEIIPWDFPDGPVVKNLLASAGTQVRSLVQEDSTYLGATKPACPRAQAPQHKKPLQGEIHVPQLESSLGSPQLGKASA